MTELSPQAQAVLDAALQYEINPECYSREIAAALEAAVDQVVPDEPMHLFNQRWMYERDVRQSIRSKILAIAAELRGGTTTENNAFTVQRTERGWAGHFICANRCRFRRNTLLERGDTRIVVSTVGLSENMKGDGFETVGDDRYFETMAFHAAFDGRYWDDDVSRQISFESPWCISEVDADDRANDQHEAVVSEISARLASGDTNFARSGEAFNQLEENQ